VSNMPNRSHPLAAHRALGVYPVRGFPENRSASASKRRATIEAAQPSIVDTESGRMRGDQTVKSALHAKIRLRVSALVIRDHKVLAVEHQKGQRRYWLLPGGGVNPGERLPFALVRECFEELGVSASPGPLAFICDSIDPMGDRHIVQITFHTSLEGEPRFTGKDPRVRSTAWLSADAIREAVFYPDLKESILEALDSDGPQRVGYVAPVWR